MADTPKDQGKLTDGEAAKRRDKTLARMLKKSPKPHKPVKETKKITGQNNK